MSNSFTQVTVQGDAITARAYHCSVVFNKRLYVLMGRNATTSFGNMYSTINGRNWVERTSLIDTEGNAIAARSEFGLCVHDKRVYLLGGNDGSNPSKYVYVTSNMVHWQKLQDAEWSARSGFVTLSFDGRLWVIGGVDAGANLNEVWWTRDGVRWTQEANAPWLIRKYLGGVVHNNRMYVIGGLGAARYNDVWYTSDGRNWHRIESSANFTARDSHATCKMGPRIILSGGQTGAGAYSAQLYHSGEGNNWIQGDDAIPQGNLRGHSLSYFNKRLFSIGGITDAATYNGDVWETQGNLFKAV